MGGDRVDAVQSRSAVSSNDLNVTTALDELFALSNAPRAVIGLMPTDGAKLLDPQVALVFVR